MTQAKTTTIGVIGAGTMGSGIALTALRAGFKVTLHDIAPDALAQAEKYIRKHLTRKGHTAALEKLTLTAKLDDLAGANVVIEAALEELSLKQELFKKLGVLCPPPAILATNTSTLPVTAIAAAADSPERVGGMHFFNPAPVLPLVEVAQGAQTAPETVAVLVDLAEQMGKTPVVTRDTPGFIVNRVARPFYTEALRLLGEQVAGHQQLDQIIRLGGEFKMGPFELMDLIGVDINFTATRSMFEQSQFEPRYRPHWLQAQKVQQNALGRKTGRGFYTYQTTGSPPDLPKPPPLTFSSGRIWMSNGSWANGLADLCEQSCYVVKRRPHKKTMLGIVVAGRQEKMKRRLREFDRLLPPETPLLCQAADTTVAEMATWLEHPQRLVGFDGLFIGQGNAATLVAAPTLSPQVRDAMQTFFTGLGRLVFWIGDAPALVLPRIVCALANEAAFALGESVADAETIDRAMTLGVNYPRGPLAWAAQLGYGRVVAVLEHLYAEYGEERYRVAPMLRRLTRLERVSSAA